MLNRLTDTLSFQGDALALRAERQRLLASNIANADTPGYQARDIDFAKALREASADRASAGRAGGAPGLAGTTQPGHLPLAGGARAEPNLLYSSPSQTNLDNNSVDMDRERAAFADNTVKYEATLRFINGSVRTMLDAIKGQ